MRRKSLKKLINFIVFKYSTKILMNSRISFPYLRIHCDFCNVNGHTVNNCRNPELNQIENELYCEKEKILMNPTIPNGSIELCGKITSIFGENIKKLKAYAIIKCKYREPRRRIEEADLYEHIVTYVFLNDIPTNTNVSISHDYIPFDENDAVQYLINFDDFVDFDDFEPTPRITHRKNVKWVFVKEIPSLTSNECPICYENFPSKNFAQMDCEHIFCITCAKKLIKSNKNIMCALCRSPIQNIKTFEP
jgi:hypothetical protein